MDLNPSGVEWLAFVVAGFAAQMVDGTVGMAYGVTLNTLLLSLGIPPAAASASVHASEVGTTFASGLSHLRLGNVDRRLFLSLVIPGVIGGIIGANILGFVEGRVIRPYIYAYLLVMGILILIHAIRKRPEREVRNRHFLRGLGVVGGFLDAVGGGGWGPIVTTTVVANGHCPRLAIGSVNAAEFFVTVAQSATFFLTIGLGYWKIVIALLVGGVLAAPLASILCRKLPTRLLMALLGCVISVVSAREIYRAWF